MENSSPIVLSRDQMTEYKRIGQAMQHMRANHLAALHSVDAFARDITTFLESKEGRPPNVQLLLEKQAETMLLSYADELAKLTARKNSALIDEVLNPEPQVVVMRDVTEVQSSGREINWKGKRLFSAWEKLLLRLSLIAVVLLVSYQVILLAGDARFWLFVLPILLVDFFLIMWGWERIEDGF